MKKRLLFLVTLLLTGAILGQLNAQTISGTDVTSMYLTNPGFESCDVTTSNAAAGGNAAPIAINGEWTQSSSAPWSSSAVVAYGGAGQVNGVSAPSADNAGNSGNTLGVSVGWGGSVSYQSSSFTLPAGSYVIKVNGYNALSGVTQFKSLFGFIPTSGTSMMSTKTQFAYGTWETDEIQLTLAQDTEGKIQIGGQAVSGGSGSNAKVFFDNIVILFNDPALTSKLTELQGVLKKAKAINIVWGNEELASLITTVEGKTYSTEEEMDTDIDAIKAYYENLETITIENGNFDTDVNIDIDGNNSATYIAPATAEKPYIYPVTGWTQNFKFSSTAAQGNTAVYGATISGDNGTNSTNPPAVDMFGNTAGGTLHLSSGWSDWARYNQVLTNLQPGKYIVYYEANNQNIGATTINSNYFGLGDIEAGNLGTNNNTFVYSDLKTYPYNEWVASATGFNLIAPEESATLNVGVVGTTGGSANGAKLWVDNVTIYYLGWDATEALTTLQGLVDTADELLTKQMNQDVKPQLVDAKANAEAVIDNSTDYDEISAAQLALSTAVNNAQESVAEYEKIKEYMDLLITADQRGDIPETTLRGADVFAKYSDGIVDGTADATTGTYTSFNEFMPLYKSFVADYWNQNKTPGANLTAFVLNQGFEMGEISATGIDFWTVTSHNGGNYIATDNDNRVANLWANYDTTEKLSQTIEGLPNGTYQLKAYVRSSNPDITLSVNGKETTLNNVENNDWPDYTEVVAVGPVSNGKLDIAVIAKYANNRSYFRADNITITFLSEDITAEAADYTLVEGQMNASVKQAMLDAESAFQSNSSVDNYNALLNAITAAQTSVGVYENINTLLGKLTVADNQFGGISRENILAMPFYTKYNDGQVNGTADATTGTYTSLNEVLNQYKADIADYYATNAPAANDDLTAFVINQGFEFGDGTGWAYTTLNDTRIASTGGSYALSDSEGSYLFNTWSNSASTTADLRQTLTGLPSGTYQLSGVFGSYANTVITISAGTESTTITADTEGAAVGVSGTLTFVSSGSTTLRISAPQFFKADNIRLTYISSEALLPTPALVEGYMKKSEDDAQIAAYNTYTAAGGNTAENYEALVKAIAAAQVSKDSYDQAKIALDAIEEFMASTNVYTYEGYNEFFTLYKGYKDMYDNRTMANTSALNLMSIFFGGEWRSTNVPVAEFLISAWDCNGAYDWTDYHVNTWSVEGNNDGTDFKTPFIEYWAASGNLQPDILTAEIKATASAEYKVSGWVRVQTTDGNEPTGLKFAIASEGQNDEVTYSYANIVWTKPEGSDFYLANVEVTGLSDYDSDGDGYGDLRMQFIVEEGTNVGWLSFKNMKAVFNGTMQESTLTSMLTELKNAIDLAESYKLGFETGEYAPYNNASQLIALNVAKGYYNVLNNLITQYNNGNITWDDVTGGINYLLIKYAKDELVNANGTNGENWVQNTTEMNAVYWTNDFTNEDVVLAPTFDANNNRTDYETIVPFGWDLDGRVDGYNTRYERLGLNAKIFSDNSTGVDAMENQSILFIKYDTNYGNMDGYTMPLKKGTKYSFTFGYAAYGHNEAKDIKTIVKIQNTRTKEYVTIYDANDNSVVNDVHVNEGCEGNNDAAVFGDFDPLNWKMYRCYFTTEAEQDDDYVVTFTKDREWRKQFGSGYLTEQLQMAIGDIYIVKYEDTAETIDGQSKDFTYSYEAPDHLAARDVTYTRSLNGGVWSTLVLPFRIIQSELNDVLGITEVYHYIGTTTRQCEDGLYRQTLHFEKSQVGVLQNVPALVKVDENAGITSQVFKNVVFKPIENDLTVEDEEGIYNLVGTYATIKVPNFGVYINNNNEYKLSTGNANLQPTRAYFKDMTEENGESKAMLVGFTLDGVSTGIIAVEADGSMNVTSGNIYTLDGRLVKQNATSLDGLAPGVYVVDGKKYVVK